MITKTKKILNCINKKSKVIISIFAGRAGDTGKDPVPEFKNSIKMSKKFKNVEILWASTREPYNYLQAKNLNCHIITVPPSIIEKIEKFGKTFQKLTTDTVKTILTPGEFVIRKEAVDMIGVPMLNMINNMPEKGGHSNIDKLIEMATTENMKGMYGGGMVNAGPKPMGTGGMVDAYRGGGMVMDQYGHGGMVKNKMMNYGHGGMVKNKMMMMEKGGQLKPVPEDNPGLGK